MNWLVVGVDPGPTPGIVAIHEDRPYVFQCDGDSLWLVVRMLLELTRNHRILAVEKFVVGPRASRSRTPQAGATTRSMVDLLRSEAGKRNVEFVERPAGMVKPWATDARLAAAGLLDPTKGMPHSRDAGRHALYAAVHAGLLPDPLSKAAK